MRLTLRKLRKLKGKAEKNRSQAAVDSPVQVACVTTLRPVEPVLRKLGVTFSLPPLSGGSSRILPGQDELETCVGTTENLRILFIIG